MVKEVDARVGELENYNNSRGSEFCSWILWQIGLRCSTWCLQGLQISPLDGTNMTIRPSDLLQKQLHSKSVTSCNLHYQDWIFWRSKHVEFGSPEKSPSGPPASNKHRLWRVSPQWRDWRSQKWPWKPLRTGTPFIPIMEVKNVSSLLLEGGRADLLILFFKTFHLYIRRCVVWFGRDFLGSTDERRLTSTKETTRSEIVGWTGESRTHPFV